MTDSNKLSRWRVACGGDDGEQFQARRWAPFSVPRRRSTVGTRIIEGEVLVVEPTPRLSYTWAGGGEEHKIVWTLQDLGDGRVNLHLEQTGFFRQQGLEGARYGWGMVRGAEKSVGTMTTRGGSVWSVAVNPRFRGVNADEGKGRGIRNWMPILTS